MERITLLKKLPPFRNNGVLIKDRQSVSDIINEVVAAHKFFQNDYCRIASDFDFGGGDVTLKKLFDFLKNNVRYEEESEENQTSKSPAAIVATGKGDCKHYALFIAGVLDALNKKGYAFDWLFRFASYDPVTRIAGHVFVVAKVNGVEYWIDPVLKTFNSRRPYPVTFKDKKINVMALRRLSGLPGLPTIGQLDPVLIAQTAGQVVNFIKSFTGDKVPDYPIKTTSTLEKIRAHIAQLIPMPPTSVDNAKQLLATTQKLMSDIAGNNDAVVKTYYMIYSEIATALKNYIATGGKGVATDAAGVPVITNTMANGGFLQNNMPLVLIGGGLLLFLLMRKK